MRESELLHRTLIEASDAGAVVFRNNTGMGYIGTVTKRTASATVIKNARVVRYGLCPGSADIIGVTPVVISRKHLGMTIGVFTAIETKGTRGRPSDKQIIFLNRIAEAGGISILTKTESDVRDIIEQAQIGEVVWGGVHGKMPRSRG